MVNVVVAGHFCPFHIGHLNLIRHAKSLGDKLTVIVANDYQAGMKRNKVFMPAIERAEILKAFKDVDEVVIAEDFTTHISETLRKIKPDIFANGCNKDHPDLKEEMKVCEELGIKVELNIGGPKIRNSSDILINYYG